MNKKWEPVTLLITGIVFTSIAFYMNEPLFLVLNSANNSTAWYYFWGYVTQLGDGFFVALVSVLLIKKYPKLTGAALFALLLSLVLTQWGKDIFGGPRPVTYFGDDLVNVIGPRLGQRSFPSGHSATIFVLATLLWKNEIGKKQRWIWFFFAFIVALSRIMVGAHFPEDIVAGMWLGVFAGICGVFLGNRITGYWSFWLRKKTQYIFNILVIFALPFMFINFKPSKYFPVFYIIFAIVVSMISIYNVFQIRKDIAA